MTNDGKSANNKRTMYIVLAAVAVVAIIGVVFALMQLSDSKKYQSYFDDGKQYYQSGDYASAITYLEKAVKLKATDESVLILADCYVKEDQLDKAIALLEKHSGSAAVKKRLEELKNSVEGDGKIEINGELYDSELTSLGLSGKGLSSADLADMAKFTALQSASLSKNKITDLDMLSGLVTLEVLDLSENSVTDISTLSGLKNLRTLYLDGNKIEDFSPLYKLSKLTTLSIKNIDITESKLKELQDALPNCRVHSEKASVDVVDITLGGMTFKSDVTNLDLSGKGISDISELSKCENLTKLDLRGNRITDLTPLMDLPELQWLCLKGNRIADLRPLMGLTRLTYLDVQNNRISSISSIGALSDLNNLYLGGNSISGFSPLFEFTALRELGLENTGLKDSDLGYLKGLSNLIKLYIDNNPGLSAGGVSSLQAALKNCKISHSELSSDITLGTTKFPADSATVNASGLGISDITPVTGFTKCHTLLLANNKISSAAALKSMTWVTSLDLSGNKLADISPIGGMTGLQSLNLMNNPITDISPLLSMTWLRELYISAAGLSEDQINTLYTTLSGCSITVDGNTQ